MPAPLLVFALIVLPDARLAEMRGGIMLANGTNISVGIALETRVDGMLALRTQFSTETPGIQVFAGGPDTTIIVDPGATVSDNLRPLPAVESSRAATGTVIGASPVTVGSSVRIGVASAGEAARSPGTALAVVENGPAVATALGAVRLLRTTGGTVTELNGPNLAIQQLVGQATGTIVTNSASDRIINTVTWVDVRLDGALMPSGLTTSIESVARAVADRARF
ncbi:hypothetical protein GCM10007973_16590 [Polymorphobacter multimanifer]|jgi:hypothetical protein|nr:hypothetical protein GCM10007973_16590 [Polymorphobacter multimanifer]